MVNPNNYQRNTVKRPLWVRRLIKAKRTVWRKSRSEPGLRQISMQFYALTLRFVACYALMYPKGEPVACHD